MLTIFCSPKPFEGETSWNQNNAIRSWRAIHPDAEIFIFGSAPGASEAAQEFGAVWVAEIESSPTYAPSFNAMAEYTGKHGRYDLQLYINADILIHKNLLNIMKVIQRRFGQFLIVGERLDLAQGVRLDTRDPAWESRLPDLAQEGNLNSHGPSGVDYFGFQRGIWRGLPPVYMGRAMCDQALLHHCLKHRISIVDATLAVCAVHQFHGYHHVTGGKQEVYGGQDRDFMAVLHGLRHSLPTIADSDWGLTGEGKFQRYLYRKRFLRRMELSVRYRLGLDRTAMFLRGLQYIRGKKSVVPKKIPLDAILSAWLRTGPARECSPHSQVVPPKLIEKV